MKITKTYGDVPSNKFIELSLEIDKSDKVSSFGFFQRGFDCFEENFHLLREKILGKKIDEAREVQLGASKLINIPYLLFLNILEEYKGEINLEDSDFLCRCFGVSTSQIRKLLISNPDLTINEIIDQTNAGGGCTSCTKDIDRLISAFHFTREIEFINPTKRYLEMTSVEFLLKVDGILNSSYAGKVRIKRLRDNFLFLESENIPKEEIKDLLERDFNSFLPVTLLLV